MTEGRIEGGRRAREGGRCVRRNEREGTARNGRRVAGKGEGGGGGERGRGRGFSKKKGNKSNLVYTYSTGPKISSSC